jgi:hypothetical protein
MVAKSGFETDSNPDLAINWVPDLNPVLIQISDLK